MGLFSSGKPKLEIDKRDKEFADNILLWLALTLGDKIPRERGQFSPTAENFNYKNLKNNDELFSLIRQVAALAGLEDENIRLEIFDPEEQAWKIHFPFNNAEIDEAKMFSVFVTDEVRRYSELTLRSVMLQLLEKKFSPAISNASNLAWIAEITADYFGFGIFSLRNIHEYNNIKTGRELVVYYDVHVYVIAMLYELTGNSMEGLEQYVSPDNFKRMERMRKAIRVSDDFPEFKADWDLALKKHPFHIKEVELPTYDLERIELFSQLLAIDKKENAPRYYNNRGYVYLLNNRHEEAIADFSRAIAADPYHAFAFNNRGYCRMMLGDLEGGSEDNETSLRLDPENSYSFRNKGIYYFKKGSFVLALEYYLKAIEKQADIEHIHFYLGTAYHALGDKEKAGAAFEVSRKIPELPVPDYPAGY